MLRWHPDLPDDLGQQLLLRQPQICGHDCGRQWWRILHGAAPEQGGWTLSAAGLSVSLKYRRFKHNAAAFLLQHCAYVLKTWMPPATITHAAEKGSLMQTSRSSKRHSLTLLSRTFHHIRSLLSRMWPRLNLFTYRACWVASNTWMAFCVPVKNGTQNASNICQNSFSCTFPHWKPVWTVPTAVNSRQEAQLWFSWVNSYVHRGYLIPCLLHSRNMSLRDIDRYCWEVCNNWTRSKRVLTSA